MLWTQFDGRYSPDSNATRQEPASYHFIERQGDLCRVRIRGLGLFPPNLSPSLRYAAETVSFAASPAAYECELALTKISLPWSKHVTLPIWERPSSRRREIPVTPGTILAAPAADMPICCGPS